MRRNQKWCLSEAEEGAISRYPLYLLLRFAPQKDAASIGAKMEVIERNIF